MKKELQQELEAMEAFFLLSCMQKEESSFKVPVHYFINKQKELNAIPDYARQFKVPDGYFDHLNEKIMETVDSMEQEIETLKKPTRDFNLRPYFTIAASIAIFLTTFFLFKNGTQQSRQATVYEELFEDGLIDALEYAYITDNAETYVLETLLEEFNPDTLIDIDPLFDEQDDIYDELFSVEGFEDLS